MGLCGAPIGGGAPMDGGPIICGGAPSGGGGPIIAGGGVCVWLGGKPFEAAPRFIAPIWLLGGMGG